MVHKRKDGSSVRWMQTTRQERLGFAAKGFAKKTDGFRDVAVVQLGDENDVAAVQLGDENVVRLNAYRNEEGSWRLSMYNFDNRRRSERMVQLAVPPELRATVSGDADDAVPAEDVPLWEWCRLTALYGAAPGATGTSDISSLCRAAEENWGVYDMAVNERLEKCFQENRVHFFSVYDDVEEVFSRIYTSAALGSTRLYVEVCSRIDKHIQRR